ncbi:MAG: glycosyltransferase family 4 protein, partial [Proteobacteria bacterium]|nr:glycosyltransferase family 4 protein [Pseudomonadota bacterium]
MPDPCRVLVLNERDRLHPKAGGAEVHVAEIFRRLTERGYEVTQLACRFGDVPPRERLDGMDVHRIGRLPFYYPRVAFRCARETEAGHYDVVVECLNKVPFYSPVYSRVPVLALCHHLFGEVAFQQVAFPIAATVWMAERFVPWVYRGRPFLAISESSRDDLVARGIPASDVRVSHPGIDPSPLAIDLDKPRAHRIAYIGRLEPYKRIDLMLRAAALLRDRFPRMELVVIGRGTAQPSLEKLASDLGLRERVTFTGFVSDEERDARLSECRLAVC